MTLPKFWFAAGVFALSRACAPAEAGGAPAATDSPAMARCRSPAPSSSRSDGSTMTLSPSEGGFALALAAPNGAAQRSTFAFMSDKLGTISDDADTGHVIGLLPRDRHRRRRAIRGWKDRSPSSPNAAGGHLADDARGRRAMRAAFAWYPSDHVFGAAEKRAALAAYADRLGLADHSKKAPRAPQTCAPAAHNRQSTGRRRARIRFLQDRHVPGRGGHELGRGRIDADRRAHFRSAHDRQLPSPRRLRLSPPPAAATQPAAPVVSQNAPPRAGREQGACAGDARIGGAGTARRVGLPRGRKRRRANIGFRNRCAYGVQFAYCLQKSSDPAADCGAGAKAGAVGANAFVLLLTDTNIKSADAERDFRWVACSGNTGSIVAHLDRGRSARGPLRACRRILNLTGDYNEEWDNEDGNEDRLQRCWRCRRWWGRAGPRVPVRGRRKRWR